MYWIYVICKLSTKRNANGILKDFKEFIKQTNKQAISLTINKNHTIRPTDYILFRPMDKQIR